MENSLSKIVLSGQCTRWKLQSWLFCAFIEKLFRENLFCSFIKNFWIKIFQKIQFLNRLLYNASYFESRILNASDLEPFFHNSTIFESKILERVRFRKKNFYNASDFEVKLSCKKNRFWWKFCFQTITSESFYPKKCYFWQLCVFSKTSNCLKKWEKTVIQTKLWKRISFWNKFSTKRQIRIKIFKINQFLVNLIQLVFFCIGSLTACQISKHPFTTHQVWNVNLNKATDFHVKLVSKHQPFLDNLLPNNLFSLSIYIVKMSKLTFSHFLRKLASMSDVFGKKTYFESKTLLKIRFWITFITKPQTFKQINYTSCQSVYWIST